MSRKMKWPDTAEGYGVEPFNTVRGSVKVVCFSHSIAKFSPGLHWLGHTLYTNKFPREDGQSL